MDKQTNERHTLAINSPSGELPEELQRLVEKRDKSERRVKDRRGGPPRRSLSESAAEGDGGAIERRKSARRTTSARRGKPRRG